MPYKNCIVCGKAFYVKPSQIGIVCCSRECRNKRSRVTLICQTCGEEFSVNKSREKTAHFCSMACLDAEFEKSRVRRKCLNCGLELVRPKYRLESDGCKVLYCSVQCANEHLFKGKPKPEGFGEKVSKRLRGVPKTEEHKEKFRGPNNPMFGRHLSESAKAAISGEKSVFWRGGAYKLGFASYDTYFPQIGFAEETRRATENPVVLQVKCTYCGKWYSPKLSDVISRTQSIQGKIEGENRLYCSSECKGLCSIYGVSLFPRGFKGRSNQNSREVQPELRKMCFERDNWECQKCGAKCALECHHIDPVVLNPIESADLDNTITLCSDCHREAHLLPGCTKSELIMAACK